MSCSPPPQQHCTTIVVVHPPPPPKPSTPPPPPPPPVPLELKECTIDAYIADVHSFVNLYQQFYNPNTVAASGIYTFSVLAGSAICGFEMIRGTKRFNAEVKDREKAQEEYDKAVKAGKTAGLGKEITKDIFSICVGNLEPKETLTIKISYINTLIDNDNLVDDYYDAQLRFTVPRAYVQRYGQPPPGGEIDTSTKTDIPFKFSLYIQQVGEIEKIETPIGPVARDPKAPNTATVSFSSGDKVPPNEDIIIAITAKGLDESRAFIEYHPLQSVKTAAVALTWMPDLDSTVYKLRPPPEMEYIVMVDRSSSMEGIKLNMVKGVLKTLLRNLNDPSPYYPDVKQKVFFNIFSYGDTVKSIWDGSREYTSRNVDDAEVEINRMQADLGGKDILKAFLSVFKSLENPGSKSRPISIFLMTDGVVYNVQECMETVRQKIIERALEIQSNLGPCPPAVETYMRVFTVGLGFGVSTYLCDGVARAGLGYSTYITRFTNGDEISGRCSRLVAASQMPPILTDFKFQWQTSMPEPVDRPRRGGPGPIRNPDAWVDRQAPKVLPDIFPFTRSSAYQLLGTRADMGTIKITSRVPSRPAEKIPLFKTNPQKLPTQKAPFIHVCAAKAVITDLEDYISLGVYSPGSVDETRAEIVRVGILYQISSRYTSFVVVDDGITVGASKQGYDYTPDPHIWPWGPGPVIPPHNVVRTVPGDSTVLPELVKLQQPDGSFGPSSKKVIDLIMSHLPNTVYASLTERGFKEDTIAALLTHLWITLKCAGEGLETKKKADEWLKKNATNVDVEAVHSSLSKIISSSLN
ncbi:hypothetical protein Clacol_007933 [Clathrus columnatus]|uniref:Uncharacterized protein n=1 Tax=Clathrus columnatus TaxID=1419009 RepID=A0AAV5AJ09_9AGAM|nr:hypothetical protein Clacol_007933 [Clathrus columnatus]